MQSTPVAVTEATAFALVNSSSSSVQPKFGRSSATPAVSRSGDTSVHCPVRTLATGEDLFREGDPRTDVYRVETGTICIYEPRWDGHRPVIRFAFPGDLVGLGFLEHHACTARAMVEARVTCLPNASMESLVVGNPKAEAELQQALEREFELRRNSWSNLVAAIRLSAWQPSWSPCLRLTSAKVEMRTSSTPLGSAG